MIKKISLSILLTTVICFAYEIRINQIGYNSNGIKRAVISSTSSTAPTSFSIVTSSGNSEEFTGTPVSMETPSGWSGNYWIADFTEFSSNGTYTLTVHNDESHSFEIGDGLLFDETAELMVDYFNGMRSQKNDSRIPFEGSRNGTVDLDGGWADAAGDQGKHLSHLSYANFFNPQQQPLPIWTMLKSYEKIPSQFQSFHSKLFNESSYGCDYLLKSLDSEGYFYTSVFDNWGYADQDKEEEKPRAICEWEGLAGNRTDTYKAGMREGAGLSIAALALASRLDISPGKSTEWLSAAKDAYSHLKSNNENYINDGTENIIDDYTALLAAVELYRADGTESYLTDINSRAERIIAKQDSEGWFYSDDAKKRHFYHGAEEGMPLIALAEAVLVTENSSYIQALTKAKEWYLSATRDGKNPFDYVPLQYTPLSSSDNLALNGSVEASTENDWEGYYASNVTDGDVTSAWNSEQGWDTNDSISEITVDLGSSETISKIKINWGYEFARHFTVEVSDGNDWNEVGQFEWAAGGVTEASFTEQSVRYIRINCLQWRWDEEWGNWESPMFYSIEEISAFGPPSESTVQSYFMPHDNETGYWWQGENARIASMSAGLVWADQAINSSNSVTEPIQEIATAGLDWILGKNSEGVSMMTGRGTVGYPTYNAEFGIPNVDGGICNGITGDLQNGFSPYYDNDAEGDASWRWIEQWIPHSSWYLLGMTLVQSTLDTSSVPISTTLSVPQQSATLIQRGNKLSISSPSINGQALNVQLFDLHGRQIIQSSIDSNSSAITLSGVSKGVYVVRVTQGGTALLTQKISLH